MRRGLTMIEVLMALSMLGAIIMISSQWTSTMTDASARLIDPAQWNADAEAVLQLIHDDLYSGDFISQDQPPQMHNSRIAVERGQLIIKTRTVQPGATGQVEHTFMHDPSIQRLILQVQDGHSSQGEQVLLSDIRSWQCRLDSDELILEVIFDSVYGTMQRRFTLP